MFCIVQGQESCKLPIFFSDRSESSFPIWIFQAAFSFSLAISVSSLFHLGERDPGNCSSLNCVLGETIWHSHAIYALTKQAKTKPVIFSQWNGFSSSQKESNIFPVFRFWRKSAALNKRRDFVLKITIVLHLCKSIHLLSYSSILRYRT